VLFIFETKKNCDCPFGVQRLWDGVAKALEQAGKTLADDNDRAKCQSSIIV
jgi:hypothetical protein